MKRVIFSVLLIGLVLMGCTQLGNYGSKESPTAPPLPFATITSSATSIPTTDACVGEGQSLGAVIPGNNAECCPGLVAHIPDQIVGTRGTCLKPENVPKTSATPSSTPPTTEVGMTNPAAVHCVSLGYTEKLDGQSLCEFTDGTTCDEWDFYRGKCGQVFSACGKQNGTLSVGSGRVGFGYYQFGLCTFTDGSQCGEGELTSGTCTQGQCKTWTAQGCQN